MGVKLDDMTEKGDRYRNAMKMLGKLFVKRFSNPLYFNKTIYHLIGARQDAPYLKVIQEFSSEIIAKRRILLEKELDHRRLNQLPDEDMYDKKSKESLYYTLSINSFMIYSYVNERRRFTMLDTLICAEKDGLIDHKGICEEVDTLIFGGFDTTSMILILTLMNLAIHPDIQDLCHREISEHIHSTFVYQTNLNILIWYCCFRSSQQLGLYAVDKAKVFGMLRKGNKSIVSSSSGYSSSNVDGNRISKWPYFTSQHTDRNARF